MHTLPDNGERYHIIRKTYFSNVVSYIIIGLTVAFGALIDAVIIGRCLGVDSMAAFSLVTPMFTVFSLFGAVISSGARYRLTMMIGKDDVDGARGIFTLSMLMGIGLSVLLMILVLVLATPICQMLGASGGAAHLLGKARSYLTAITIGLPAMNAVWVMTAFITIDNDGRLALLSSFVQTIVNIVLNCFVAYVISGDIFEIGLVTSISYYAALLVLLPHFRRKERLMRFSFSAIRRKEFLSVLADGMPMGAGHVSNAVRSVILNQLMAAGAAGAAGCIAAYSVQRQANTLLSCLVFSLSDTLLMLTGILMAEQNRPTLRRLLKTSFRSVGLVVTGVAILLFLLSPQFASVFISDASGETLRYAADAARCYAIGMPLFALNNIFDAYSEGRGKRSLSLLLKFCSEGGLIVLSTLVLLPLIGIQAVWISFPVSQALQLVLTALVIVAQNRKLQLKPTNFWKWYMALPEDFDVPKADRIDCTITSHEQVITLYHAAIDFCTDHGCDERRKYLISLAVEEMATHTIQYGFRPGKQNNIDMRILKKGDDYIVRIRDDCVIFDPVKKLQLYDKNIPMHHIGLQMVIGTARDVRYTTILGLNNLVIRI